jgi:thymidylate synthase ThyX
MTKRVLAVGPMPPEKCAYALARYSRSPDSIAASIEWVRTHNSQKFLESFYFQYGHASIADLGHLVMCFEGISELAATEVEDEPLWDGQARSSRYQNFSKSGVVTPPEFDSAQAARYQAAAAKLLEGYSAIHATAVAFLSDRLPRPEAMKPEMYQRNIAARAFDLARYVLPFGVPTGIGQVTSIRTLERQIRRLKASDYAELRDLADEISAACAAEPVCPWDLNGTLGAGREALAPTLARHVDTDEHTRQSRADLRHWATQNLPKTTLSQAEAVDLIRPDNITADIVATLLYPVTDRPYRELLEFACASSATLRAEIIDVAMRSRTKRDDLLRNFRSAPFVYDIVMDIGAYRDLHRHRRCHQLRQDYTTKLGFATPQALSDAGIEASYEALIVEILDTVVDLPTHGREYLLPLATKSRFLFKMDFAEAEYISRLRSGVKGHFSYRQIAWKMKEKMQEIEPELGRLMQAIPPWIEDPLQR